MNGPRGVAGRACADRGDRRLDRVAGRDPAMQLVEDRARGRVGNRDVGRDHSARAGPAWSGVSPANAQGSAAGSRSFLPCSGGRATTAIAGQLASGRARAGPTSCAFASSAGTIVRCSPRMAVSELKVRGQLMDGNGVPIAIDGLWGLSFGPTITNARPDGLYFAAGPDDETHGLFGVVAPVSSP